MMLRRFAAHIRRISQIAAVSAGALIAFSTANAEAFQISAAQRAACTPDVMRLCSSELPDSSRVIACMRANKAQVSAGCKATIPARAWNATDTKVAER